MLRIKTKKYYIPYFLLTFI